MIPYNLTCPSKTTVPLLVDVTGRCMFANRKIKCVHTKKLRVCSTVEPQTYCKMLPNTSLSRTRSLASLLIYRFTFCPGTLCGSFFFWMISRCRRPSLLCDSRRREAADEGGDAHQQGDDEHVSGAVHGQGSTGETCREEMMSVSILSCACVCVSVVLDIIYN